MKLIRYQSKEFEKIFIHREVTKKRVYTLVQKILNDVKTKGDSAVIKYTKKYDGIKLTSKNLRVSESEINGCFQDIDAGFVDNLKVALANVSLFYKKQSKKSWKMKGQDGVSLGEVIIPIECVGIYVPAGTAPLVSSVYMSVLPAKIAGVKRIILCTPADKNGNVNPHILAVANLLNVNEIYKVGGAQAIAAMAFGTKTIPKVDKIIGPGNEYVTEAKRQVFGHVDIDMTAGPSEVVIIANQNTNNNYIKADLEAQAEHHKGTAILLTTSKPQAKFFKSLPVHGYIILAKNIKQVCEISNRIAPEHLEIMVKNPRSVIKDIKNAGAIFIGPYSPTAIGDYIAGPSHILPTGGAARFFSGISLDSFLKKLHTIFYSKKALEKVKDCVASVAKLEAMEKHIESIKVRLQ